MAANSDWYYAQGDRQFGPLTWNELCAMATDVRLNPSDLVWTNGLPDWTPAGHIAGLIVRFEQIQPRPAGNNPNWPPPNVQAWANALYHAVTQPTAKAPAHALGPTDPSGVNRILVGLMAIFFGWLGIHKFLLGRTIPGVIMLLATILTAGIGAVFMVPIGIIEGILYLSRSDDDFQRIYLVGKKAWF